MRFPESLAILILGLICGYLLTKTPLDDDSTYDYYRATYIKNYDGDTLTCDIDLGLGVVLKDQKIRLYGINTPEIKGGTEASKLKALIAKNFLADQFTENKEFIIKTEKDKRGKFGRIIAICYNSEFENINHLLINKGLAVTYME